MMNNDDDNKTTTTNSGLGVIDVISIIYITLKIIGVEPVSQWPWWLVLSPWLIYIALIAILALVARCIKNRKN